MLCEAVVPYLFFAYFTLFSSKITKLILNLELLSTKNLDPNPKSYKMI